MIIASASKADKSAEQYRSLPPVDSVVSWEEAAAMIEIILDYREFSNDDINYDLVDFIESLAEKGSLTVRELIETAMNYRITGYDIFAEFFGVSVPSGLSIY